MYLRISLYKPFLFGLMDIRIYVSITVVRMDEFMYGCMYVCMYVCTTVCLDGWIYRRMYACPWLNSWSVDVKMDFY